MGGSNDRLGRDHRRVESQDVSDPLTAFTRASEVVVD